MADSQRATIIILDSLGVGALPDADQYGDRHTNTLAHVCRAVGGLALPHLTAMGLGNLGHFSGIPPAASPSACHGRLGEISAGKDSTTGHWELMGLVTEKPFPTYPQGFPRPLMAAIEDAIGTKTLGNVAASGTDIIQQLGDRHLETAYPIVYTSVDSVFQVAAHEDVIPVNRLYTICETAREILVPPHGICRVIARPFTGSSGAYRRTAARRDFTLSPPGKTLLNLVKDAGHAVIGVGKIGDLFAGSGLTRSVYARDNGESVDRTLEAMGDLTTGIVISNLVDFDMHYGHRNDPRGYGQALTAFDRRIPELLAKLRPGDLLVITADHGCDPTTEGTDHTREFVPLLLWGEPLRTGTDVGNRDSMADLGCTLHDYFGLDGNLRGESFWKQIARKD